MFWDRNKDDKDATPNESDKDVEEADDSANEIVVLRTTIEDLNEQIEKEKAAKRKIFHGLVKLANELKKVKAESGPLVRREEYATQSRYEGGMWRAPRVLPGVNRPTTPEQKVRLREAVSLSDLFFNIVVVTAFTRVGVTISDNRRVDMSSLLYFAIFWTIWSKEASYATRFDTTDLSAMFVSLVTCFAVLFGSLSCQAPVTTVAGTRMMMVAGFVAFLNFFLHLRVTLWYSREDGILQGHVKRYALLVAGMSLMETLTWAIGILAFPTESDFRFVVFVVGVLLALRVPRAFMANDFHAACSKRGVLFILLLGFLLQSVMVAASSFFQYETPTFEQYSFIGAACLLLFCIKLLYVDDSAARAADHALLVNRIAAFSFNIGQFCLLLSTTVMGSGLTLLTHSYLAAAAALPDNAKNLICGGFSAVLLSIFFIKSMHIRRIPTDGCHQSIFIGAYAIQTIVMLAVAGVTAAMCYGHGGYLQMLMQNDIELLFVLSGFALLVVLMDWLDEAVELNLYKSVEDSHQFLVQPFGVWWCLQPEVTEDEIAATESEMMQHEAAGLSRNASLSRLSVLSPLLGSSVADLKMSTRRLVYDSLVGDNSEHEEFDGASSL